LLELAGSTNTIKKIYNRGYLYN